jgi:transcriptional antiterminator RfaH
MTNWCAAFTQPRSEATAVRHLNQQGFEVYLPVFRKRRSHARKIDVVRAPLFPGYIFVAVDVDRTPWRCIDSTVGVSYLVRNGSQPAVVPPAVIQSLRESEDGHGYVTVAPPQLSPGEQVRITGGPFDNLIGRFERMNDRERVVVLLELLGRATPTVLPREAVSRFQ